MMMGAIVRTDERATAFRIKALRTRLPVPPRSRSATAAASSRPTRSRRRSSPRSSARPRHPRELVGQGPSMLVPTLVEHGTEEQKQKFVRDTLARQDQLVPGLQRAGLRQRPGVAAHPRRARRRLLGGQRPEDLDLERRHLGVDVLPGAHRARRAEARRHQLPADRHEDARPRRPAAAPDDRRRRLQRGVPRQRARAGQEHRRQARPGLGGQPLHAEARARHDRQLRAQPAHARRR